MDNQDLFKGFSAEGWKEALSEQADYLKEKYGFDLLENNPIDAAQMNASAQETIRFQTALAQALREGLSSADAAVQALLNDHLAFLNAHGQTMDVKGLVNQAKFIVKDDFHRKMMEGMQIGLAFYYLAAVLAFAESRS